MTDLVDAQLFRRAQPAVVVERLFLEEAPDTGARREELAVAHPLLLGGGEDRALTARLEVGHDLVGRSLQLVAGFGVGEALDHQEAIALILLDLTVVQHRSHDQSVGAAPRHAYPLGMELTVLGHTVRHAIEHVEAFPAPANVTTVRFTTDEVASMCPVTQQPDLSRVVIEYAPDQWCVESKSLKLYLWGFRDRAVFAEALAAEIAAKS